MFTLLPIAVAWLWRPFHFRAAMKQLVIALAAACTTAATLVAIDFWVLTTLYSHTPPHGIASAMVPWNLARYNASLSRLAQHGLHPWYTVLLVSLPFLLGPWIIPCSVAVARVGRTLLPSSSRRLSPEALLLSASVVQGVVCLSCVPHQVSLQCFCLQTYTSP